MPATRSGMATYAAPTPTRPTPPTGPAERPQAPSAKVLTPEQQRLADAARKYPGHVEVNCPMCNPDGWQKLLTEVMRVSEPSPV